MMLQAEGNKWLSVSLIITYISELSAVIALVYSVWAYGKVKTLMNNEWINNIILLCVVWNIVQMAAWAHDIYSGAKPWSEALLTFLDVAGYFGLQNVLYWLFGFKYWVIAR